MPVNLARQALPVESLGKGVVLLTCAVKTVPMLSGEWASSGSTLLNFLMFPTTIGTLTVPVWKV